MESKRMCLKSYIRKLYYEKKISNDEMKCLLEKLEGHDKHLIRNERKSVIDCFTNRLSEYLGVENATKYGNKNAEQQRNSYSTMMMYEVADLVDDLIEIVKQEAEKYEECYKDCGQCEAYDKEKHYCPKWCDVIKGTVAEIEENHSNDFCEWKEKSVGGIELVREPHRMKLFHIEEERKFCPYCGKKIKAVE